MTEPTQASSHLRKSLWRNDQAILTIAAMAIGLIEAVAEVSSGVHFVISVCLLAIATVVFAFVCFLQYRIDKGGQRWRLAVLCGISIVAALGGCALLYSKANHNNGKNGADRHQDADTIQHSPTTMTTTVAPTLGGTTSGVCSPSAIGGAGTTIISCSVNQSPDSTPKAPRRKEK